MNADCFYRVSAMGVIRNQSGQILMVNEHGAFTLPGGGWEFGEDLHDALKRELHEEILLTSDFREQVITAITFHNPNKGWWQMIVMCEILYDQLEYGVGEHASDVQWFDTKDIDTTTLAGGLVKDVLRAQ